MDEVPTEASVLVWPKDAANEDKEGIDKLMTNLPEDITNEQRKLFCCFVTEVLSR